MEKIRVVLVTGFLGAGKTTFINEVIKKHQHLKLALVENEFGEKSIDQDLIIGMRADNIFDLSNGCICCTISNEFSLTLLDLADKAGELDFLLIETTGIADLSNVIRPFYDDEDLRERYELQGSVCLVDARNFEEQLAGNEQQMQVILSDLLIINKTNEIEAKTLPGLERQLLAYNGSALVEHTNFGLLEDFSLAEFSERVKGKLEQKLSQPVMFRVVESKKYSTFTHQFPGFINLERFQYWFNYYAAINQREIYRIKGLLVTQNSPFKTIVQSVGGAVSYAEGSFLEPGEEPVNTLVFIGKDIDHERVVYELMHYLEGK
ncbi:CobW family GTP-binding protein [Mangrovibacterium diazotrophicum]|uniref:G3E family GTPase n=1 Tax=Mangrovibacterium diazotrophicum TaxID=1261403 RepID=A0A419W357_9BACT|nr:GTP-binding protein [Mangrovibacterium diazotrophicum]RKD89915.1 G3E family GTPase [Mangrovibacterium diazotrophicum]